MTVTTMGEFEALTSGTVITVNGNNNVWERTEAGWSKDGVTLESVHFTGDVKQMHVHVGAAPEVGQMWDNSDAPSLGYKCILLERDGDEWWCLRFTMANEFSALRKVPATIPGRLVPPSERPEWYANAYAMGLVMLSLRKERDQIVEAHNKSFTDLSKIRTEVQPALQRMVDSYPDLLPHANEFLTANGMSPCNVEVPVSIKARVQKYITVPSESMASLVPEGATASASQTLATFEMPMEFKVRGVAGECACALVTRRMVVNRVREMGHGDLYDSSILSRSCPNDPVPEQPF